MSLPIPVPTAGLAEKDSAQPFPCQNRPCGCKTAEQCWTGCCCFTPSERLAWAEENGVAPPSYAQLPASDDTAGQGGLIAASMGQMTTGSEASCCASRRPCCEKQSLTTVHKPKTIGLKVGDVDKVAIAKPTGAKSGGTCCETANAYKVGGSKSKNSSAKRKVVLGMFALKCQGKSSVFHSLPWVILAHAPNEVLLGPEARPAYHPAPVEPAPVYSKPDTPPPRQMFS
ncbi:hypothetical protein VN12_25310 [Pirellula sp. SH-Sr6A]|uniref:hypothetical protein n=1 Tax=Pirellula sp. SH-Sr6A TaxID=1632865 RepID=UPI00078DFFB6|nr:hypothetical protein [Pirellula sp. SH-Sr6A]AMV35434.1 hypothetical protein VN12_25310 [Pirellula sp. SH-Sr6A]